MFTGIVEALGTIEDFSPVGGDWQLKVNSETLDFSDVGEGDSIAVSGICLTVSRLGENWFVADVSNETVNCTAMDTLSAGDRVNLEKAVLASDRLGGHIVSGHVDGIAELISKKSDGRSEKMQLAVPGDLARYIAEKGSVCLDGVSLTVNEVDGNRFSVNVIPHTVAVTTFRFCRSGQKINIEVDVVSRYLERLLEAAREPRTQGLTLEQLEKSGFVRPEPRKAGSDGT